MKLNRIFRKIIVLKFSFLISIKRYFVVYKDTIRSTRKTYSQFGEDLIVKEVISNIPPTKGIYIEIGANQPTQISNTYLFYRLGFHGIVIEPNHQMTKLFKRFRPKDIHFEIGCAEASGVGKFKKADFSVLSGFSSDIISIPNKICWVPLLKCD